MQRTLAASLAVCILLGPTTALGLSFRFLSEFDVGALGASPSGTPRGIAVRSDNGNLLVSDALDDAVFEVTPSGTPVSSFSTDPICAIAAPGCTGTESARLVWDLAFAGGSIWLINKELVNGSSAELYQLDGAGAFIAKTDITFATQQPGGLDVDPRTGDLLVTDRGSDDASRIDISGTPTPTDIYGLSASGAPNGIAAFGTSGTFLVSDSVANTVYEFSIPTGTGPSSFLGESDFLDIDISTVGGMTSLDFDAVSQRLYILDDAADRVLVFGVVPEPGSGALLALGLLGLARRREARHGRA